MNSLQGSFLIALFREDKNTMWVAQRPPPGCDRARSTGPPTSRWTLHPYMWWEWRLWADAVPWQHRTVLVCGPKWTGNPWDSLWSWQQTNVWVNDTLFISGSVSHCVLTDQISRTNGGFQEVPPPDPWLFSVYLRQVLTMVVRHNLWDPPLDLTSTPCL